jgi:hypothetical protein
MHSSHIKNSSTSGTITILYPSRGHLAVLSGLVFTAVNSIVEESYSTVEMVTEATRPMLAGLILIMEDGSILRNSFFAGRFVKNENIVSLTGGGLVKWAWEATIANSFVLGELDGFTGFRGLVGYLYFTSLLNNFWNKESLGVIYPHRPNHADPVFQNTILDNYGLSVSEMRNPQIFIDNGWDFENVWISCPEINDGFPYLRSMMRDSVSIIDINAPAVTMISSFVYPNPARNSDVRFQVSGVMSQVGLSIEPTEISIFNIRGQLIQRSSDFHLNAFTWNRRDLSNNEVPSGVYFYRITADTGSTFGRFLIIRD